MSFASLKGECQGSPSVVPLHTKAVAKKGRPTAAKTVVVEINVYLVRLPKQGLPNSICAKNTDWDRSCIIAKRQSEHLITVKSRVLLTPDFGFYFLSLSVQP